MQKQDWIAVGMKLVGVYVAALALIGASSTVLNTVITLIFSDRPVSMSFWKLVGVVLIKVLLMGPIVPAAQGFVAWVLLKRTCWCMKKIGMSCEPQQM